MQSGVLLSRLLYSSLVCLCSPLERFSTCQDIEPEFQLFGTRYFPKSAEGISVPPKEIGSKGEILYLLVNGTNSVLFTFNAPLCHSEKGSLNDVSCVLGNVSLTDIATSSAYALDSTRTQSCCILIFTTIIQMFTKDSFLDGCTFIWCKCSLEQTPTYHIISSAGLCKVVETTVTLSLWHSERLFEGYLPPNCYCHSICISDNLDTKLI